MSKLNTYITKKKAVVVLAIQRSGSSMLCDDLTSTNLFGTPGEALLGAIRNGGDVLGDMMRECQRDNSEFFSIKLMLNQMQPFSSYVSHETEHAEQPAAYRRQAIQFFYDNFDAVHFIHLIRNNIFLHALSHYMKEITGVNALYSDGKCSAAGAKNALFQKIIKEMPLLLAIGTIAAFSENEASQLQSVVDEYCTDSDVYTVSYEDIANPPYAYVEDFARKIGIRDEVVVNRKMRKVVNYDTNEPYKEIQRFYKNQTSESLHRSTQGKIGDIPACDLVYLTRKYSFLMDQEKAWEYAKLALEKEKSLETLFNFALVAIDTGHAALAKKLLSTCAKVDPQELSVQRQLERLA